uniref:Lipid transfer protein 2 n=1 Tax=Allium sativum TaxID=4682 RepID=A6N9I8_ALLSA|nr:lipid transfer protein 2 [Allium sativum]
MVRVVSLLAAWSFILLIMIISSPYANGQNICPRVNRIVNPCVAYGLGRAPIAPCCRALNDLRFVDSRNLRRAACRCLVGVVNRNPGLRRNNRFQNVPGDCRNNFVRPFWWRPRIQCNRVNLMDKLEYLDAEE